VQRREGEILPALDNCPQLSIEEGRGKRGGGGGGGESLTSSSRDLSPFGEKKEEGVRGSQSVFAYPSVSKGKKRREKRGKITIRLKIHQFTRCPLPVLSSDRRGEKKNFQKYSKAG